MSQSGLPKFDVDAGPTAAAVVLPKAMAYATVAGLPVAVGLSTAFVPMPVYAFLGSSRYGPRVVALDMSRVPDLEYSALQSMVEGGKRMTEAGLEVWLVGLNPGVLEMARHSGLAERLGRDRMLFNARAAIERFESRQKPGERAGCPSSHEARRPGRSWNPGHPASAAVPVVAGMPVAPLASEPNFPSQTHGRMES